MNLDETQQRIRWVTFAVLIGVTILLLVLDSSGSLDNAFNFFEDPLTTVMGWTTTRVDTLIETFAGPEDLQAAQAR